MQKKYLGEADVSGAVLMGRACSCAGGDYDSTALELERVK